MVQRYGARVRLGHMECTSKVIGSLPRMVDQLYSRLLSHEDEPHPKMMGQALDVLSKRSMLKVLIVRLREITSNHSLRSDLGKRGRSLCLPSLLTCVLR